MLAYQEIIDFIAAGCTAEAVASYQPSDAAKARAFELITKEKDATITAEERSELDSYMQIEHIMRIAKAKARGNLARNGAA